jgi:hypothetical protein
MGKLYFHAGDFEGTPEGTQVLGSLTATNQQMSELGKALRAPEGPEDLLHLFSNSQDAYNGLRIAVGRLDIVASDVLVIFRKDGEVHECPMLQHGTIPRYPHGMYDQVSLDLRELSKFRRAPKPEQTTE